MDILFASPTEQILGACCPVCPEEVPREFAFLTCCGRVDADGDNTPICFEGPGLLSPRMYCGEGGVCVLKTGVYIALFCLQVAGEGTVLTLCCDETPVPGATVEAQDDDGTLLGQAVFLIRAGEVVTVRSKTPIRLAADRPEQTLASLSLVEL